MKELYIIPLLLVGVSLVFAEEVDIPFQPQGMDCQSYEDTQYLRYACVWMAEKEKGIKVVQDDLDEDDIRTLDEIKKAKEDGTYERPPDQYKPEDDADDDNPVTTTDWLKKRACEGERESDKALCHHLNQLSQCEQGVEHTESEPVSTYRKFVVSDGERIHGKNFDLQDNYFLRDIYLKIEECYAIWQVLQPTVLGAQYLDFIRQSEDLQPYHADMASVREQVRTHSDLTKYTWERTQTEAHLVICYSDKYGQATKLMYGCNIGYDGVFKNNTGMTAFEKRLMETDPMTAYELYKNDPNNFRLDGKGNFIIINEVQGDFAIEVKR